MDFDSKKAWLVIFFPGCHNCNPRVQRHFLRKSNFLFKKVIFVRLFWVFEQICLFFDKKLSGCQRNNLLIHKKLEDKVCKFCFLKSFLDFEQKSLNNSRKRNLQDCQNYIKRVQRNNFRTFFFEWRNFDQVSWSLSEIIGLLVWIFCQNFSKLQPTGAAESFDVFFRREEYMFDRFQSLSEKNRLLARNIWHLAVLLKNAFHVSSEKLWEKMTEVIITIIIFFGTLSEFFLILAKKIVRCVETVNKCTEGKTSKKYSWKIGFSSFLEFDKKKLYFCRKVFGRVVKSTFYVSRGTLTAQHFRKEVLKT